MRECSEGSIILKKDFKIVIEWFQKRTSDLANPSVKNPFDKTTTNNINAR